MPSIIIKVLQTGLKLTYRLQQFSCCRRVICNLAVNITLQHPPELLLLCVLITFSYNEHSFGVGQTGNFYTVTTHYLKTNALFLSNCLKTRI